MYALILLPIAAIVIPLFMARARFKKGKSAKKILITNLAVFAASVCLCIAIPMGAAAAGTGDAQDNTPVAAAEASAKDEAAGWGFLAMAIVTGLGALSSGIAVAASAPAAIGATVEDPKAFGKSLIFVAMAEGIAIYGILISILIFSKL